jgi:hypothetical protein
LKLTKLLAAMSLSSVSATANAQDYHGVGYAGGSLGQGTNGYAGLVVAVPGARLGHGLAVRGTLIGGNYRYDTGTGVRIHGKYIGGEAALVYQFSGDWGWSNISAGPRLTHTSLSPSDPDNKRDGSRWDVGTQIDGAFNFDPKWRLTYLGSVGIRDGAYLVKADVGPFIDSKSQTRIGVEGSLQGDPKYKARGAGVFVGTQFQKDAQIQLSAGIRDQSARKAGAYGAIATSFLF